MRSCSFEVSYFVFFCFQKFHFTINEIIQISVWGCRLVWHGMAWLLCQQQEMPLATEDSQKLKRAWALISAKNNENVENEKKEKIRTSEELTIFQNVSLPSWQFENLLLFCRFLMLISAGTLYTQNHTDKSLLATSY